MANTKETSASNGAGEATVIGQSMVINGKVTGDEDLTVRGRVEGELALTHTLIVEPSGVLKANATVKNAIISGVVVGNVDAVESVELTREGRMVGDIHAPRVILVEGASFRGRIEMGEVQPGRQAGERATRPTLRPSRAARGQKPAPPPPPSLRMDRRPGQNGKSLSRGELPPLPPLLAAGAKKKVVVKKKMH
jgi:cytoskeletal protein CcmA (bactofilin family)